MPKPTPIHAGDATLVAIGEAVRALRTAQGISQENLATDVGIERSYLSGIKRGRKNLTIMALQRMASSLEVSLIDIMAHARV